MIGFIICLYDFLPKGNRRRSQLLGAHNSIKFPFYNTYAESPSQAVALMGMMNWLQWRIP